MLYIYGVWRIRNNAYELLPSYRSKTDTVPFSGPSIFEADYDAEIESMGIIIYHVSILFPWREVIEKTASTFLNRIQNMKSCMYTRTV